MHRTNFIQLSVIGKYEVKQKALHRYQVLIFYKFILICSMLWHCTMTSLWSMWVGVQLY